MNRSFILIIFALVVGAYLVGAAEFCPSSYQTSSVYVQYANLTPATNAEVTLKLWNGTEVLMANMGGGIYNYSYYVPAYNTTSTNTYIHYFNSSNPTTSGAEDFTVKSTCATTNGSTSYLPIIVAIGILICGVFYIGLTLNDEHYPLKLFLLWVGIWLFVPLTRFISLIASVENLDSRIYSMIDLFSYATLIMAMLVTLYFMYLVVKNYLMFLSSKKGKSPLRLQ